MKIYKMLGDLLGENTYLLFEEGSIIVIDPGCPADKLLFAAERLGGRISAVLLTHGHADHALGASALEDAGIHVYLLGGEETLLNGRANLALALGVSVPKVKAPRLLRDGETLSLPPFSVSVIATPGHTAGGASYLIAGALFSGDTLFRGSYGRADLPSGDEADLICSIANELFSLPPETPVYSGHSDLLPSTPVFPGVYPAEPDTFIGEERECNPILDLL